MGRILAFAEIRGGRITRLSLEALSRCREIARRRRGATAAVAVLSDDPAAYFEELARYGAEEAFAVTDAAFASPPAAPRPPRNARLTAALACIIEQAAPDAVVLPSEETVKEILGALAVRVSAPALPDASGFDAPRGAVEARRPVFAAGFIAHVRAEGAPVLVSLRAGSYAASERPAPRGLTVRNVPFAFDERASGNVLCESAQAASGGVDLAEASVVVAAGRGVRDEKGKRLVEELAVLLGAAVGASRGAVETGLFSPSSLIGQTGKTVSPDVYVAVGISGALQHVAGMSGSRTVIAINRDAAAPVFRHATYGIAGDLYEVLPALIRALKEKSTANGGAP